MTDSVQERERQRNLKFKMFSTFVKSQQLESTQKFCFVHSWTRTPWTWIDFWICYIKRI